MFRDRLKEELASRSWTRDVLAEKTGINKGLLNLVIQGRRRFNEEQLISIARALELQPYELFLSGPALELGRFDAELQAVLRELVFLMQIPVVRRGILSKFDDLQALYREEIRAFLVAGGGRVGGPGS